MFTFIILDPYSGDYGNMDADTILITKTKLSHFVCQSQKGKNYFCSITCVQTREQEVILVKKTLYKVKI